MWRIADRGSTASTMNAGAPTKSIARFLSPGYKKTNKNFRGFCYHVPFFAGDVLPPKPLITLLGFAVFDTTCCFEQTDLGVAAFGVTDFEVICLGEPARHKGHAHGPVGSCFIERAVRQNRCKIRENVYLIHRKEFIIRRRGFKRK